MAIIFKGDIRKAPHDITNERLKALLDEKEPKIARFLVRFWGEQKNAITYQELREMVLTGEVDSAMIEQWFDEYSRFVVAYLMPEWRIMAEKAAKSITERHPVFVFNPGAEEAAKFTAAHAAELVTNCTSQQIEAIRAMVNRATAVQDVTVDELGRMIRPTIGLYKGQAVANLNYYRTVRNDLREAFPNMRAATVEKRAREAAAKYAGIQHRYRAQMIARTELSFGYNTGEFNGIKQAQAQGYMGPVEKQWVTADDERVCSRCKALDLVQVPMDAPFPGTEVLTPPLHPHCRCVLNYIEI